MTRRYFSGSTLDQAVMMAARHHGVEPDELAYRQIEKRHGFLRSRKAVMIAVDPDNPRRERQPADIEPPPATAEPVTPPPVAAEIEPLVPEPVKVEAPPPIEEPVEAAAEVETAPPAAAPEPEDSWERPGEEAAPPPASAAPRETVRGETPDDELLEAAERATRTLLQFAGIEGEAKASAGEERVEVEIEGPDSSVLVVEGGKGLLAIQHLLPRLLRGMTGRSSFVRVDSRDFHRKRRERLEALAQKEADAATRNGSARTLPPMAPDERRIVHLALKEMPTVVTESRGSGLHKRVVIRPVEEVRNRDDIEARHGI